MKRGTFVVLNPVKPTRTESWWQEAARNPNLPRRDFFAAADARVEQMNSTPEARAVEAVRRDCFPKRYQSRWGGDAA